MEQNSTRDISRRRDTILSLAITVDGPDFMQLERTVRHTVNSVETATDGTILQPPVRAEIVTVIINNHLDPADRSRSSLRGKSSLRRTQ